MVDVLIVPEGFEEPVGEAEGEQVLDRLLAQVVVDAEDAVGVEDLFDGDVQLMSRFLIVAEGLLDDDSGPGIGRMLAAMRQTVGGELLGDSLEGVGRYGEVERMVAFGASLRLQLIERLAQSPEGLIVVEPLRRDEPQSLAQAVPRLLIEARARA